MTTSLTFYPDAHPESTSVDGWAGHRIGGGLSWANLVAAAGSVADSDNLSVYATYIQSESTTDKWYEIIRGILVFDTSAIPAGSTILSATLSLYGIEKYDYLSITPTINIYSSNPASDTGVVTGDYDSLGATAFSDSPITYANWSITGYNDFPLNSSGIAAITVNGITKLGVRSTYDADGTAPAWSYPSPAWTSVVFWSAEKGTTFRPKLVVEYAEGINGTIWVEGTGGGDSHFWIEGTGSSGGYVWIE